MNQSLVTVVQMPALAAGAAQPVSPWLSAPFVILLLMIALMPFVRRHWWEQHYPKVAIGLALAMSLYYLLVRREALPWVHAIEEYANFIILLTALFVISGGIVLRVNRQATPLANTVLLLLGSILANLFGTTGAAMLLIRPYLRMNRGHTKPFHIVFFIITVANVGGSLTPIGDPPLFLGYLEGVPFTWVAEHLWAVWALTLGILLVVFFITDSVDHRHQPRPPRNNGGPQVHLLGTHNFVFITLAILAVFRPSIFVAAAQVQQGLLRGLLACASSREILMVVAAVLSRVVTPKSLYQANHFNYGPIREVAILFAGIFCTMIPALQWLEGNAQRLQLTTPGQYYVATGSLSAVLDNAPTYLTFFRTRIAAANPDDVAQAVAAVRDMQARHSITPPSDLSPAARQAVEAAVVLHGDGVRDGSLTERQIQACFLLSSPSVSLYLIAISVGAVFFGACTYIGNGPNFMVRSIAESEGVQVPSFIGYVVRYTLPILVPVYVLVWWLFLRAH